jgi:hypothetical protein
VVAEATERFAEMMQRADPALRQQLDDELGIAIYHTPGHNSVEVTIHPPRGLQVVSEGRQVL